MKKQYNQGFVCFAVQSVNKTSWDALLKAAIDAGYLSAAGDKVMMFMARYHECLGFSYIPKGNEKQNSRLQNASKDWFEKTNVPVVSMEEWFDYFQKNPYVYAVDVKLEGTSTATIDFDHKVVLFDKHYMLSFNSLNIVQDAIARRTPIIK